MQTITLQLIFLTLYIFRAIGPVGAPGPQGEPGIKGDQQTAIEGPKGDKG